jgi:GDP-L-fucose synthase
MRTMVTGGYGLVGSSIESTFKPKRDEVDLKNICDIVDYLTTNQIDSIVHCAAKVGGIKANSEYLGEFYYKNIMMNTNVLEAARLSGVTKVVSFLSTCVFPSDAIYPLTPNQIHQGEPHLSNYGYAYAKRMLEVQSRAYRDQYGCNFVTVIPCNIYGPHDNYNLDSGHVIPSLIHKCYLAKKNGTDFDIWGTGNPLREFIYSEDVGKVVQWVLENYNDAEPLIISPDNEVSISDISKMIAEIMGYEGRTVFNRKRDGQHRKPSDNSKLKHLMSDFNLVRIEDGLRKSIEWFVENYKEVRK